MTTWALHEAVSLGMSMDPELRLACSATVFRGIRAASA